MDKRQLQAQLAENSLYSDDNKSRLQDLLLQQSTLDQQLRDCEEQWLTASDELETLIKDA
jgi:ATP-binding cassette subfamily F protein 3